MQSVTISDAVALIPDGATLMIGGFMGVGTPERLIDELVRQGKRNLTVIANDNAMPGRGIGKLVDAGLVASTIASHIGLNPETQKQMIAGKMKVDLVPQGTLVERIRAGGAGLGGVLTPTGVGTVVEEGKQRIEVNGKALPARNGAARRLRLAWRLSRRLHGQPHLCVDHAQLQSGHGNGRGHHDRDRRAYRAGRTDPAGSRRDAGAAHRLSRRQCLMDQKSWMLNRSSPSVSRRN